MRTLVVGKGAMANAVIETLRLEESDWQQIGFDRASDAPGFPYFVTVVCHHDPAERHRMILRIMAERHHLLRNVVHPKAIVSPRAHLGGGCVINAGAVIQPDAVLGLGVMVHVGATIDQNCWIGDCATIGPGANLAGWARVGRRAKIYTNATLIPRVIVGYEAEVAAGATVTKDVEVGHVVAGTPAIVVATRGTL